MNIYILSLCALAAFIMCHTPGVESSINGKSAGSAVATFKQYCSGCHGADANVFVDRNWKHGNTKADIIKSITNGYPDLSMPAWGVVLKPEQINDLSDYILASIENRKSFDFKETPKSNLFTGGSINIKLDTVAKGIKINNPALQAMTGGSFKSETIPISVVGMNQAKVQQMLDRVGFK